MLHYSLHAPRLLSKGTAGGASTASYSSPLLHRSPLQKHHASNLSIPSWPQRIHVHPSSRVVSCQAKRTSPRHGKRGNSSDDGSILSNIDKLLAQQPERRVGPSQKNVPGDRNRSSTPSNQGPFNKPTLSESLDMVEAAASPSPVATADMLISLGNALNREAKYRQLRSVEHTRVAAAMAKLSDLLLEKQRGSKRIEQLDGKKLSLSAWAMGKVGSKGIQVSTRLGDAFAECACACPSMDGPEARGEGWRRWANLLYGLAEAGMVCGSSKPVRAAFDKAVNDRLLVEGQECNGQDVSNIFYATVNAGYDGNLQPLVSALAGDLKEVMANATAQAWSNTIWALAKHEEMKAGRLGQGKAAVLQGGVAAMLDFVRRGHAVPQDLSNLLWALPKLAWDGSATAVGELASALATQSASANPQELSNTLWALSELGWYDASIYSTLMSALVQRVKFAEPQALSNSLLACAEAQHWDRNVERLSELVSKQSVQQWEQWKEQEIANALYSWAVLTAAHAATPSPGLKNMAQRLFNRAAIRRESYFVKAHFSQLYMAHQVAVRVGLPGGGMSADQVLMRACARSYEASLLELRNKIRRTASMEQEVAAALQHAGYDVDRSIIVGSKFMQLQAQGVAVTVVAAKDFFCAPLGLLRGRIAVHNVMASWVCKGCMVISEAEWADLVGDPQRQQAFVSQRLEQALSKA